MSGAGIVQPTHRSSPASASGGAPQGAATGGEAFCERDPIAIHALLKALMDRNVPLQLSTPEGVTYASTIWSLEAGKRLGLTGKVLDPAVHRLVESSEVTASAYLDRVRVQFELEALVLVHGNVHSVLQAALPREVYRFQRRAAYRVQPLEHGTPSAMLRHPSIPEMELALRVLDLSSTGCALFVPDDVPPLPPGAEIAGARLELDMQTSIPVTLGLRHVTCMQADVGGARLGCEWLHPDPAAQRALQRYIDSVQKRRRLLNI